MAKKASVESSVKPAAKPVLGAAGARPLGVTVICILVLIGAILSLLGGATLAAFGGVLTGMSGLGIFGALMPVLGAVMVIIGLVSFVEFWWLWKMLKKGYMLAMILSVVGLVIGVVTMNVISILLNLIVIVYLYMKRALFV